jgi:hypothetical protein
MKEILTVTDFSVRWSVVLNSDRKDVLTVLGIPEFEGIRVEEVELYLK